MQTPDLQQLEESYRQMSDGQILKLAEDPDSLTDPARKALNAELCRRHLEEATAGSRPVPGDPAGLDAPELRQLKETYGQMTDAEILRLATEMDSLPDQTADVLYAEVCRRKLEEAVAGEALPLERRAGLMSPAEVPQPFEAEDLPIESDLRSGLEEARSYKWGRFQGWVLVTVGSLYGGLSIFSIVHTFRSEGTAVPHFWHTAIGLLSAPPVRFVSASLLVATGVGLLKKRRYGLKLMYSCCILLLSDWLLQFLAGSKYVKGYVVDFTDLAFWCIPAIFYYPRRWKEFR